MWRFVQFTYLFLINDNTLLKYIFKSFNHRSLILTRLTPLQRPFFHYCYFYWDTQRKPLRRRELSRRKCNR